MPTFWQGLAQKRYIICLFCFFATCCAYIERTGFSVAFTALCKRDAVAERVEGMVMGAFFIGYAVSQIPGGMLAQRFGGRRTLIASFLGWSVAASLTPSTANSAIATSAVRITVGVFQGALIPSVHTVLSEWVLPQERAKATSLCTSGMYLGSAAAIQFLPGVAARFDDPSVIFRLVAGLGALWLALWIAFGEDVKHRDSLIPVTLSSSAAASASTSTKPHAAASPSAAVSAAVAADAADDDSGRGSNAKAIAPTPWKRIMSHPAVWSIVINNFTFHYIFYTIMNWMPTYFESFLGRDLKSIGIGKPLPYIVMFAMSNVGGWSGDWLIRAGLTVGAARKTVNTIGFAAAVALLMLMPTARSVAQGLTVLTLCLGACGLARGGFSVNHMDIAPRYAGILMGISNTAGTISGIIGVSATGFMLESAGGSSESGGWYRAHAIASAMAVVGVGVFIVFGRGERLFS